MPDALALICMQHMCCDHCMLVAQFATILSIEIHDIWRKLEAEVSHAEQPSWGPPASGQLSDLLSNMQKNGVCQKLQD